MQLLTDLKLDMTNVQAPAIENDAPCIKLSQIVHVKGITLSSLVAFSRALRSRVTILK